MVLGEGPLSSGEKFPRPTAFTAQARGPDLGTSRMSKISSTPIDLPPEMIVSVHHLMGQCVLEMRSVSQLVGADPDPEVGVEAARGLSVWWTSPTADVGRVDVVVEEIDVIAHEPDGGT